MNVNYMIATDFPDYYSHPVLYKEIRNDEGLYYESWGVKRPWWEEDNDAMAAFIGFWDAKRITEEEALSIIERFGGQGERNSAASA